MTAASFVIVKSVYMPIQHLRQQGGYQHGYIERAKSESFNFLYRLLMKEVNYRKW